MQSAMFADCVHAEAHQVKKRDWEAADYYSSDEDIYLDRTGSIELKRKQRMKRLKKEENSKGETYDSLVSTFFLFMLIFLTNS
jgi:hypothetical protein